MKPTQDFCLPFTLDKSDLRGRFTRLGKSVQDIITRHDYPVAVNHMLAEMTALAVLLSSALKVTGRFTLQTASIGPVPVMVVDIGTDRRMRAYARIERERFAAVVRELGEEAVLGSVPNLLGQGNLGFTVEIDGHDNRYQGMVSLEGETLSDCAKSYFRQSEQLDTSFKLVATQGPGPREWWAGGMMVQRLPVGRDDRPLANAQEIDEEDWRRACILLDSVTPQEVLDISLKPETLLYRLFHEEEVRGYPAAAFSFGCKCSRAGLRRTLAHFPKQELAALRADGEDHIRVTCEFCGTGYSFTEADLSD